MRRRRLFWQLFPATLLIALAALAVVALDATTSLRQFYLDRTAEDLESRARLAEDQIVPLLAAGKYAEIDALCKELGKRSSTRFTVILPNGKVVGDTEKSPQEMDNHAARREVSEALDKGVGSSLRPSDTLKQDLRYVAVSVRQDGRTLGVVRAAVSLAAIDGALAGIRLHILIASALVAVVLAAASLIIARRSVKPLEELRQHAEWFARGDLTHRLPAGGTEEIGGLAETLNQMAAELHDKLAEVVRQRNERDTILSSMVEGVLAIDADEHVLSMNAAAARLLGADSGRAEGRSLPEIIRSIDLHKLVAAVFATRQPVEGDVVLRNPDLCFLRVHGTVLRDGPAARAGALLVIHDITELKRLENVRRDFVANVSHELKTPVTAIQGYVETLLDGPMNDSQQREKFLTIVAKHTDRLHAILEDLLMLARVEQEGEKRENLLAAGPLRPVLEAALVDCRSKAEEKRMRLTVNCPAEQELTMNASLLEQAVVNLLENAIAYSSQGGSVEVDCVENEREVEIRVRDYGCGIAREHLPRLFERFYRVDKSRSRDSGGTGLGLAIVKHIMQLHGGRATVESTPGVGSTFSLVLPK
jgi:two-component system, OmpR family, phosphate regulon sensor histidine kinase PhoR